MRITFKTSIDRALIDFSRVQERLAELQRQIATGKKVAKPSDDPAAMNRALAIRTDLTANGQYLRDIDSGMARLGTTEAALGSTTEILQRVRELAVLGANGTLDQSQLNEVASEVNQLLEEMISVGNTKFASQYVFGGHQTTATPFTGVGVPPTSVTYNGDGGVIERDISEGIRVQVNVAGDTALSSTFSALITLRDDLQAGNIAAISGADLGNLDTALDDVLTVRGQLGATSNRLELTRNRLDGAGLSAREQLSGLEDADFVDTLVRLNAQEAALEAALGTVARSIQSTLLNFLR